MVLENDRGENEEKITTLLALISHPQPGFPDFT
jgi:hypothetical protein